MTKRCSPKIRSHLTTIWLVVALGVGFGASVVAEETLAESEAATDERLSFELDVMPVLSVAGCNAGACHGKQGGQNGFQLSLLGFDAESDYTAIVHEAHGRRLAPAAPKRSLLLRKVSAQVPHGGGLRLAPDSPLYDVLQRWIVQGMLRSTDSDPVLERITLAPEQRTLEPESELSLVTTAHYSDGSTRDVTHLTTYQSSESAIVAVDDDGTLRAGSLAGKMSIMARYVTEIAPWNTGVYPLPVRSIQPITSSCQGGILLTVWCETSCSK
ncbi:MAG: hypothetical protein ABGX16_10620 [Pirellulales bacterium]